MGSTVAVRHKFETAHRLQYLGGKCANLHGHSWHVEWTFAGALDGEGMLMDFGDLKRPLHQWVDEHLDHGAMLGTRDTLLGALLDDGCKVYTFGRDKWCEDLPWPTVEAVSVLLGRLGRVVVADNPTVHCVRCTVTETRDNTAGWSGA